METAQLYFLFVCFCTNEQGKKMTMKTNHELHVAEYDLTDIEHT